MTLLGFVKKNSFNIYTYKERELFYKKLKMSKNISKLSGRMFKDNLFQKLSEESLNSKNGEGMKELADKYHVGVSTIHGAKRFYEFLRHEHKNKKSFCLQWKRMYVCRYKIT